MLLALIFALSLDGLLVGVAYSLRRIKLSLAAYAMVGLTTAVLMGLAVLAGSSLGALITPKQGNLLGGYLLLGVGLWQLAQGWQHKIASAPTDQVASIRLRSLGLVVQILRDPQAADLNCSGNIDLREATLLGLALGLDALGAGFALALTHLSLWAIPLTGICAMGMLFIGCLLGDRLEEIRLSRWGWAAPGLVLIVLGLLEL
jgi:putative sporulation protein YtaF